MAEIKVTLEGVNPVDFYGEKNVNINIIKNAFPEVKITSRGHNIKIKGSTADAIVVETKLLEMMDVLKQNEGLSKHNIHDLLNGHQTQDAPAESKSNGKNVIVYGRNGKPIKAKTANQKKLVKESESNDILFAIGPAGTGKTYTAVALAVRALKNRLVRKIIMTRPAVEAGENLGFLPGDLKDKIDPYLRPLYDGLDDMLPPDKLNYFMDNRIIEVAPLAFMRGRTLDNAFIILDEAQNATSMQIKMFLTRLGPSAQCVITGDLTQIDLPYNQKSGLAKSLEILKDVDGIGVVMLDGQDVVRHRLVRTILKKYEEADNKLKS